MNFLNHSLKRVRNFGENWKMRSKKRLRKQSATVKKDKIVSDYTEHSNGVRISYHEKVCAERMKTLFKAIDEMRSDIKELKADMNKGKGVVSFLVLMGGLVTAIIGYFKWNG